MNKFKAFLVMVSLILLANKAEASKLEFPATPIKVINSNEDWGKLEVSTMRVDPGKWSIYTNNGAELGVVIFDAVLSSATLDVFTSKNSTLNSSQIAQLSKLDNPSTLRRCAQEGKTTIIETQKRRLLQCEFVHVDRMIVKRDGNDICIPNSAYEAHAFAISQGKLIQIYLIRYRQKEEADQALLKQLAKEFETIISGLEWN